MFGRWIVVGGGSLPLPLIYVDDVTDALMLAAKRPGMDGTSVNLVDPTSITQREYIRYIQSHDRTVKAWFVPQPLLILAAMAFESLGSLLKRHMPLSRYRIRSIRPLCNFDITAARERLGWTPRVGIQEGLRRTFTAMNSIRMS
jgi:nucleoside-diphosphate-sugar epimerase